LREGRELGGGRRRAQPVNTGVKIRTSILAGRVTTFTGFGSHKSRTYNFLCSFPIATCMHYLCCRIVVLSSVYSVKVFANFLSEISDFLFLSLLISDYFKHYLGHKLKVNYAQTEYLLTLGISKVYRKFPASFGNEFTMTYVVERFDTAA